MYSLSLNIKDLRHIEILLVYSIKKKKKVLLFKEKKM